MRSELDATRLTTAARDWIEGCAQSTTTRRRPGCSGSGTTQCCATRCAVLAAIGRSMACHVALSRAIRRNYLTLFSWIQYLCKQGIQRTEGENVQQSWVVMISLYHGLRVHNRRRRTAGALTIPSDDLLFVGRAIVHRRRRAARVAASAPHASAARVRGAAVAARGACGVTLRRREDAAATCRKHGVVCASTKAVPRAGQASSPCGRGAVRHKRRVCL